MTNHPIVHIELSSNDRLRDAKFYSELFGWKMEHFEDIGYTMFDPGTEPGGGLAPVGENMQAGSTMVHVGTDDIEASLAKVVSLGGMQLVPKTEIPGMGWFALFTDLSGNIIGLYTAMQRSG
jgi:predicted enzyme related to lactoylglutathione lyase